MHLGPHRTAEQPAQAFSGGPAQGGLSDQGGGRIADAAAPAAPAQSPREPDQAHEAAALLPAQGALHSAWQCRSGSNVDGLAATGTPANSPGAQCAAAGPQHGQAELAVQQDPASPEAEPVQAPAPQAAEQLPASDALALAGAAGPAVWDGPAWPGEEAPVERQAPPSTAARAASSAAPGGAGAAGAGAAAGAELSDSGVGPCSERTDPGLSRGEGESPRDGREGRVGGASRAAEGPTSTSRPIWGLSQPSQGGFGGNARVHDVSLGASPGWRTVIANAAPAGTRPGSAHMRVPEAAATVPSVRGGWSSPGPHAGTAVSNRAAAGEGADQQAGGGVQHGAVQPRANPGPPVGTRTAEQISAAARAAKDILKGPPRSSRDDPAFQQTFWQASRLHFIGSWKARGRSLAPPRASVFARGVCRCCCMRAYACARGALRVSACHAACKSCVSPQW